MQHELKNKMRTSVYVTLEGVGMSAMSGVIGQALTTVQRKKVCTAQFPT